MITTEGYKTDEERKKFMPGKKGGDLTIDGTRAPRARPSDEAEQTVQPRNHFACRSTTGTGG